MERGLKGTSNILRHMLVEEEKIPPQPIRPYIPRPSPVRTSPGPVQEQKPEEKLDLEELDKKLEEILGK